MKKFIYCIAVLAAALTLTFYAASVSEAEVKITIKNSRSHNLSFAFCWAGFDSPDDMSKGWYNVKAGETRTITFKDVVWALNNAHDTFGYYAEGTPKGKKTLYWKGNGGDEYMEYWIHPTKSFTGNRDDSIDGGQKVSFRKIKLKEVGGERTDGSATLTFNP